MDETVYISGRGGKARVEYNAGKGSVLETFEDFGDGVLRTAYSRDGRVIDRELLAEGGRAKDWAARVAKRIGAAMASAEYDDVRIGRPCPHCGGSISLYAEERDIPIMPIYVCAACKGRSIDLTDEYLARLVMGNRGLFDQKELAELERNPETFGSELKGHIIRIYASKHVARI